MSFDDLYYFERIGRGGGGALFIKASLLRREKGHPMGAGPSPIEIYKYTPAEAHGVGDVALGPG
jgi:hypothetical protein